MSGNRGTTGNRGRRSSVCSFCGKSHAHAGPMVKAPARFYLLVLHRVVAQPHSWKSTGAARAAQRSRRFASGAKSMIF